MTKAKRTDKTKTEAKGTARMASLSAKNAAEASCSGGSPVALEPRMDCGQALGVLASRVTLNVCGMSVAPNGL